MVDIGGMLTASAGGLGGQSGAAPIDQPPDPEGGASPLAAAPFDWVGLIGTGQSLSIGATAGTISPKQPYGNFSLQDSGPNPRYPLSGGQPLWSLVPLVEPMRPSSTGSGPGYSDGQYPNNLAGETPHSGMANTISWLWKQRGESSDYVTVHSAVGWSGHALSDIDKAGGQRAYPASLSEARAITALAKQQGKTFGYGAVIVTHGETDATTPTYGEGLWQLYQDYDTDLKAITGQATDLVMLVSQQSSKAGGSSGSAAQVFRAGRAHPAQLICTGPKYQYDYGADKLHLPAAGYRRLGEKYAEVFDLVVNQHAAWEPLGPKSVKRNGDVIEVAFNVPNPPLVWSQDLAPPHQTLHSEWAAGRGFEVVTDAEQSVAIAAAEIAGSSVLLTLKDAPSADVPLTVRYAITQDGDGNQAGEVLGLRGLLRDSDPFLGVDAETIATKVTQGSRTITSVELSAFRRRAGYDIVSQNGVPIAPVVSSRDSDEQLTLSAPWPGATGTVPLSFHYDLYNYCVHFSMPAQ